jgi:hypothetical protein
VAEDAPWHERQTYIRLAVSVLTAVVAGRMVDRYGWGDGLLRGIAFAVLVDVLALTDWPAMRRAGMVRRVGVAGVLLGAALYLVATFGLGERGPGGTLCVAALALLGVASVGMWLRPSASA